MMRNTMISGVCDRSRRSSYRTLKVSLTGVIILTLPFLITVETNDGRERCYGARVILTSNGIEGIPPPISCLPNCTATNENCTWLKLPTSSSQQPPHDLILRWRPGRDPKGQYICVGKNNVPVEELLIISEHGKFTSSLLANKL